MLLSLCGDRLGMFVVRLSLTHSGKLYASSLKQLYVGCCSSKGFLDNSIVTNSSGSSILLKGSSQRPVSSTFNNGVGGYVQRRCIVSLFPCIYRL